MSDAQFGVEPPRYACCVRQGLHRSSRKIGGEENISERYLVVRAGFCFHTLLSNRLFRF